MTALDRSAGSLPEPTDVVVIGGGFAGVTAARELSRAGLGVLLLEARDRLGGRTWTAKRLDNRVELGGMHVHWLQPFVWSEITRYGIAVTPPGQIDNATWVAAGKRQTGSFDDLVHALDAPLTRLLADCRAVFPNPQHPRANLEAIAELDSLPVTRRIDDVAVDPSERSLLRAFWNLQFCAPSSEGALTQALRWGALAGGDWQLLWEVLGGFEFARGTSDLLEAIAADGDASVRLNAQVERVASSSGDGAVSVRCVDGSEVAASFVVVTVPINALHQIRFEPSPEGLAEVAAEGQVSRGLKIWAEVAGDPGAWCGLADDNPITWMSTHSRSGNGALLVGFGPDGRALQADDPAAVEAALQPLLPGVRVLRSAGHDWVGDAFSRQTWGMLRPGQLTRLLSRNTESTGPVLFAGGDLAQGWAGFIDGAIESGLRAAAEIRRVVSTSR